MKDKKMCSVLCVCLCVCLSVYVCECVIFLVILQVPHALGHSPPFLTQSRTIFPLNRGYLCKRTIVVVSGFRC